MNKRKDARQYAQKGQSAIHRKNYKTAIVDYSRAILFNRNHSSYLFGMAVSLAEEERYNKSCMLYKRVVTMNPSDAAAFYNFAYVLDMLGKIDEGIEMYKEAIRLDPADVDGHKNLAILLTTKGKCDEAREHYSKVLELQPSDKSVVVNGLGCLYFIEGEFQKATEEFQKAIELEKEFAHAHCNMSLILFCEGKNEEAMKYFEYGIETLERKENKIKVMKEMIVSYKDHRTRLETEVKQNDGKATLFRIMIEGLTKMIDLLTQQLEK